MIMIQIKSVRPKDVHFNVIYKDRHNGGNIISNKG